MVKQKLKVSFFCNHLDNSIFTLVLNNIKIMVCSKHQKQKARFL